MLTILTMAVAYVDLGALSTIVALGIACTKMMLVAHHTYQSVHCGWRSCC